MHNGCHRMCQGARQEHWQIAVINLSCNKLDREWVSEREWVEERENAEIESRKDSEPKYKKEAARAWLSLKILERMKKMEVIMSKTETQRTRMRKRETECRWEWS